MDLNFGWEVGVAFLAVIVLMALPHVSRKMHGKVDYIQTHELSRMLKSREPVVVFDLRSDKDFSNYRIVEASQLPADKVESQLQQLKQQGTSSEPIVLVCASDLDSTRMASRFRKNGIENVKVMQGGMYRWKRDSLPIKRT